MKYFYLILLGCPIVLLPVLTPEFSSKKNNHSIVNADETCKHNNGIEGSWTVDHTFNQFKLEEDHAKGISHEWYEKIKFKNDTFFLEKHTWYQPRKSSNGTEYLPFEGKNFYKGAYILKSDSLQIQGICTDYLYQFNDAVSCMVSKSFTFVLSADTLELSENDILKVRLFRSAK